MRRPPLPPPEQCDLTHAIGAYLAARINEADLARAYRRAYPGHAIPRNKLALMRILRRKITTPPQSCEGE